MVCSGRWWQAAQEKEAPSPHIVQRKTGPKMKGGWSLSLGPPFAQARRGLEIWVMKRGQEREDKKDERNKAIANAE